MFVEVAEIPGVTTIERVLRSLDDCRTCTLSCVGIIGAAEALSRQMTRGRIDEATAVVPEAVGLSVNVTTLWRAYVGSSWSKSHV
ncbi:hypothetical protein GCM10011499_31680 [Pelagibacterium lentulum]|uniref:Uncharacterized protein n=1 Tax=Pelagibacterium lentulum TaxID=2029865 RepID=A0A916W1R7_9HYPH|nr:hypothetical protein [Pelagibacterium lentulum]GGA59226.1 hypothetical protein GCM10011499_31680 [Pelagibacterium lentulum]